MKNILTACILNLIIFFSPTIRAESIMKPVNDEIPGTISGRIQSLTMYRDFESKGANGFNTTLGAVLEYTSPVVAGFDAGLAYNFADELHDNNASGILANDDINLLNEKWLRYNFGLINLSNTTATVGRKINTGEVFRKDDFRQKARSIEAFQLESRDITNTKMTVGHAWKMSNWIDAGDKWEFNNFGDVFGAADDTDGVTWAEVVNTCADGLEIALFDAYAWDVANLVGTRTKLSINDDTALVGYYRHENDVGDMPSHDSDAFGLSLQQKVGSVSFLEPGYFGVRGDDLRFEETTIGINHPLGALMEICSCPFAGDSDTVYIKATTNLDCTKTFFYALYSATWHDYSNRAFDGQEVNVVIKQPICENLTMAFKGGVGYRNGKNNTPDTTDADLRLFVTYSF